MPTRTRTVIATVLQGGQQFFVHTMYHDIVYYIAVSSPDHILIISFSAQAANNITMKTKRFPALHRGGL